MYVLLAVIFYIRRKPSICVMYLYLLINKTQTLMKIDWRSDHFYCIKTQQITSYYKLVNFTQLYVSLIFNCQKSLDNLYQSIKDILKITN